MQVLDQALAGVLYSIPVPWKALAEEIQPAPGQIVTVLGAPGTGKSILAVVWALSLKEPVLFASIDTDLATLAARTVSHRSGVPVGEVKKNLPQWQEWLRARRTTLPMVTDYPLYAADFDSLIKAFEEMYGCGPQMVVVDNLTDVTKTLDNQGYRDALRELHHLARKHKTTFVILHELNRGQDMDGSRFPSLGGGSYVGEKDSEIVLGVIQKQDHFTIGTQIGIKVLKNRSGKKGTEVYLNADFDRMRVA